MDRLFGSKAGKYTHFCSVIMNGGLLMKVYNSRIRKTMVTKGNQGFTIRIFVT